MRRAAAVSVLAHACIAAAVLARWHPAPRPPEEAPGRIEVIFGRNALNQGAPAAARSAAVPVPPQAPPPVAAASPDGIRPASTPSVRTEPLAAPPAADEQVRLGDGLVGFDVPVRDPGMVAAQADPGNRPPRYPDGARARGEHGTVVLRIHIRPDGLVGTVETLQSSGFADLDESAVAAVRRWHFIPQLRDGQAVASVRDQGVDFFLE